MKKTYCVIGHIIDCDDENVFIVEGNAVKDRLSRKFIDRFTNKGDARKLMQRDYQLLADEWNTDKARKTKDEIWLDISIWNAEANKKDFIQCHWKVVEV